MSKYTEIRELLKEDINEIVEQRIAERMESIINTLMPAVLEHVSNSLSIPSVSTHVTGVYTPDIKRTGLQMNMGDGRTKSISDAFLTIDPQYYLMKWDNVDREFVRHEQRLQKLESLIPKEDNANPPQKTAP